ncbi:3'-5' exonuclease [Sulfurovum sp. bin170]|uniref:exonuclease domain-containing protein n=1 Tax=Sulfurovum sp. bin170 TaxID=2695268 RepID=UPI0013E0CD3D|nr:exonuclease domain-containing protein [Sulfurovum sp. bin170]NEW61354.1 3'-5' exonuclease [Sulfurovum sp. bin170]
MTKYILFDTETTGNQDEDRIIQVGAMVVGAKGAVEVYDELCSSDVAIKTEAMEVHNITPELLEGKAPFSSTKFYKDIQSLNSENNYLIAHNISFDLGMLKKEGFENRMKLIDTLRCSKHLYPDSNYHRLQYFRYSLDLYQDEQREADKHGITIKAHDAIGDVLVMKLLLSKLVAKVKEQYRGVNPMLKLEELTNTPVFMKSFKFGKYKGEQIEDIARSDAGYIRWMLKSLDLDEDLKYTLERVLENA